MSDAVAPPRILVVDDHSAVRAGLARAIEEAQMVCCAMAASKSEAMAQLAHTNPDAMVVDLNLPDGSGLDLIRWARKNSKEIAIVMLTMSDNESDLIAAMSAGASGYVKKSHRQEEARRNGKSQTEIFNRSQGDRHSHR